MKLTFPAFDQRELDLLKECLDSKWVTQGAITKEFERRVAKLHDAPHALVASSCTAALHLSVLALGLGPEDEVIVPAFTWVTSANVVEYVGAKVVFVDIDADTFNIDPAAFEAAISPRTKAVIVVHLFGLAAEMDDIMDVAKGHDIAVIEDCACALGTTYKGRPVGVIGDVGCFSFHPRKILTTGEGGMVITKRDDLAETVNSLRSHGDTGYPPGEEVGPWSMATFDILGFNYRMSDIQAAVGVAQMEKFDRLLKERRRLGMAYSERLAEVSGLALPTASADIAGHTFQSYVIRLLDGEKERRRRVMECLWSDEIHTRPGTHAVHRLGYYARKYNLRPDAFPLAAACEDTTITLPLFSGLTDDDQDLVVDSLIKAMVIR